MLARNVIGSLVIVLFASGTARATPITIADSVGEFSSVQGTDGWLYGYYATPAVSSSFTLLPFQASQNYYAEHIPSSPPWTLVSAMGGHPDAGSGHWAVRRWVSEVSGPVLLSGNIAKENLNGGGVAPDTGVVGRIYVDGVEVFSQFISGGDGVGVNYAFGAPATLGAAIDFAIDPNGNDYYDLTRFTAKVDFTPVPEPGTLSLCVAAMAGALAVRRRRRA